ncbi:MAG: alcohol dehydrogenase catalytic domain-containing protein [Acidobacteria bacterium]|nr:alcohol dehydrogenase catalytic domain-containing protein [Acidobacteriota bacterium]
MRIAQLQERRKFQLAEGPLDDPGPGEIQVRVEAVGICGSDMHSFSDGRIGDTICTYPMVLGHEPTGVVVKTGTGVAGWTPGDRAAFEPAVYCYHCEFCLAGRHNICEHIKFFSTPPDPGFFREFVNLPAQNVLPLAAEIGFREGTLFEPLGVVLHSLKFVALRPSESAVVFGAGPIGLLTIAMLKMCGAGRVWAVEPVPHRREMAKAAGADAVMDPHGLDAAREILSDTGQRGVDVTIDCAAREDSLSQCVHATRNGGRIVVTGIHAELEPLIALHPARRKELAIYNVRRSNHDSETALEILRQHPARFAPIVTHTLPLDAVQAAFNMLESYSDGAGKVVLTPR